MPTLGSQASVTDCWAAAVTHVQNKANQLSTSVLRPDQPWCPLLGAPAQRFLTSSLPEGRGVRTTLEPIHLILTAVLIVPTCLSTGMARLTARGRNCSKRGFFFCELQLIFYGGPSPAVANLMIAEGIAAPAVPRFAVHLRAVAQACQPLRRGWNLRQRASVAD